MATIYKRGKVYWARAQRKGREFRQSLETRDRRVAEKRLQQWLDDLEAASWGDRPRIAFATAVKTFILEYLPSKKPNAAKRYGISLKWLGDKFGSMYLHEIGREELNSFENWRRGLGASNPTIRRDFACLSSLFTFGEDKEWIDEGRNPVPGYMRRGAKRGLVEGPGRKRYLSEAEEARLLSAATPAVRTALVVAIDTGLRDQEQFTLTWPQLDFARGVIRTTTDTKNGRSRIVPLPERSSQALAQIRAQQQRDKIATLNVFAHEDGTRIVRQYKGLKAAARRAKIDDLCWHDLRRTAGCRWLQRDKQSMEAVCKLLGQSSVAVTEKSYAFLEEEAVAVQVAAQKPAHRPADKQKKRSKNKAKT